MNQRTGSLGVALLFVLPFAAAFLVFFVGPTLFGLGMSFLDWEMLSGLPPRWAGAGNYLEALHDARFHRSLWVTGLFVLITVPLNLCAALGLAAGVSALPKRQGLYRSLIYLPVLLNITVASLLWRWFYSTKFGLFNKLLQPWGVELPWLTNPALALPSISLMTVWWTSGVSFLILLTAFQQVSPSLYEAAEIDGATPWQKFRFVSLPQIMPVLGFCLLLEVLASFKVFGQPFLMTGGGPEGATRVAMQYIYETGFSFFRMGYASALSWIAFLLIFGVTLLHRAATWAGKAGKMNRRPHPWLLEVAVALASGLYLLPLLFLLLVSLKPKAEILVFDRILPVRWTTEHYHRLFSNAEVIPIGSWLANSFLISSFTTLLVVAVSALAAYAICRLQPRWGRWFLVLLAAAMMLPGQVLLVPMYLILNALGWLDSPRALVIPAAAGAFGVFLLTRFFQSIPDELEAAAEIDGCGAWGKFVHVALPHARSALVALGIITFIGTWNDFLGPLVFLDSIRKYTLPVGLALFQSSYANDYGLLFAASVVSSLPLLAVFVVFQAQIVRGISMTGMKE